MTPKAIVLANRRSRYCEISESRYRLGQVAFGHRVRPQASVRWSRCAEAAPSESQPYETSRATRVGQDSDARSASVKSRTALPY